MATNPSYSHSGLPGATVPRKDTRSPLICDLWSVQPLPCLGMLTENVYSFIGYCKVLCLVSNSLFICPTSNYFFFSSVLILSSVCACFNENSDTWQVASFWFFHLLLSVGVVTIWIFFVNMYISSYFFYLEYYPRWYFYMPQNHLFSLLCIL